MNNKLIKIKHKIAIPFMSIIVLMPLLTLLVFNIVMNAYVTKTTINELDSRAMTSDKLFVRWCSLFQFLIVSARINPLAFFRFLYSNFWYTVLNRSRDGLLNSSTTLVLWC
jgi:hypothetical protein